MTINSCLLAPNEQLGFNDHRLRWPLMGSVKFDGTRCLAMPDGRLLTRNMKPQKNANLYAYLGDLLHLSKCAEVVFDLELYDHDLGTHGDHTAILAAHEAPISVGMRANVFDAVPISDWEAGKTLIPYRGRYAWLCELLKAQECAHTDVVEHFMLDGPEIANEFFEAAVRDGYEGIMLRDPQAAYKHGRGTVKEHIIFKFKQFVTEDCRILEVIQRRKLKESARLAEDRKMTPTGHLERIHTDASYEPDDCVGAFRVITEDGTVSEINYGRGFPMQTRRLHWKDRAELIGKMIEVRHLPHGAKEGVRIGTLVRFRPDKD